MSLKKWTTSLVIAVVAQWSLTTAVVSQDLTNNQPAGHGGDFTLQSFSGPVSLESLRGKFVLMFFGYTSCPDVCPTTLSFLAKSFSRLTREELDRVTALFISVDPERDTVDVLQEYTSYFHPNIIGVTASMAVINQITVNYGVSYERKEEPESVLGYAIFHSPDILVIDSEGQLLDKRFRSNATSKELTADIRSLINSNQ